MNVAHAILALFVALVLHEGAHALLMMFYGIKIKSFGLGMPWPNIGLRIPLGKNKPVLNIHPLLIGAYVEPESEEDVEKLPISVQNHISGAGVVINILTAAIIFAATGGMAIMGIAFTPLKLVLIIFAILIFSKIISNYIVPLLGIGYLYLLINSVSQSGVESVGGPVTIINHLTNSGFSFIEMLAIISLLLGVANMMPIYPIDGGRIFVATLERIHMPKFIINTAKNTGAMAFIFLILFVIYIEVVRFT